ncbi:MAG: ATP-binding protein [Candidatus Heimdallarchaeota archaeon]|nr:ATP-binding protein [Candidatus Heimdallarchaeota archaeon]
MIFEKDFNDINIEDINFIIEQEISENIELEFKEKLNIDTGDETKEFLFDVSSFLNTKGGIIIYGVSEKRLNSKKTGIIDKILGINRTETNDELILKIESKIRSNLQPKPYHLLKLK